MYNIKSKMMSANNEMKIREIVKNFYEQNPNSEIMVVPIKLNENNKIHKIENKIEINSTDINKDINIKMTTANSNTETYYINSGCMERSFFDEYLKDNATRPVLQKIIDYWTDEEECLEYKVFGLDNPNDRKKLEYSECWLLDYKDGYLPLIVCGINTSSCYSMCRCSMDRELDDDEEPEKLTLDEIGEMMSEGYKGSTKTTIQKIERKEEAIKLNACKIEKLNEKEPESKTTDTTNKMTEAIVKTATPQTRAERNNNVGVGATGGGSMEISDNLPLFMREGGMEEIDRRRKELATYLKLLNANPEQMIRGHTLVCLNQATLDPNEVGAEQARDIKKWFDTPKTKQEIREWLGCGTHKVDGKSWCSGEMGSRWADKKINGRPVRFAFYKDKEQKPAHLKHLAYSIIIDASM